MTLSQAGSRHNEELIQDSTHVINHLFDNHMPLELECKTMSARDMPPLDIDKNDESMQLLDYEGAKNEHHVSAQIPDYEGSNGRIHFQC